jgi:hypothetical protein
MVHTMRIPGEFGQGYTVACCVYRLAGYPWAVFALTWGGDGAERVRGRYVMREYTTGRLVASGRTQWEAYERGVSVLSDMGEHRLHAAVCGFRAAGLALNDAEGV